MGAPTSSSAFLSAAAAGLALALGGGSRDVAAADGQPLDRFFQGAVVGLSGSKVKLRYDFSSAAQQKDWPNGQPFNTVADPTTSTLVSEGRLFVRGSIGVRHVAEFEGDVVVTARLVPDGVKDIGSFVSSPEQVDDYVTYSVDDHYWHAWDNKTSAGAGMMKFGKQFATSPQGGYVGFRYLDFRKPPTAPVAGKPVAWSFGRRGDKVFMTMDDLDLKSVEPGNKLKVLQVGFYAMRSSMSVDDVVVEGTLSARFVDRMRLALRTEKPLAGEVAAGVDPAVLSVVEAYRAGKGTPTELVSVVGDAARPAADRSAAAEALKAGPKRGVAAAVDLLYSTDLAARVHGLDIVKALTGKTYGYDPKAGEKARQTAVRRLNEDLPKLLKDDPG